MNLAGKNQPLNGPGIPYFHWKMATVLGGAYFVFVAERILKFVLNRRKVRFVPSLFLLPSWCTIEIMLILIT